MKEYGRRAGLEVNPHMLRHSGARDFIRNGGVNLPELQQKMNHRSMKSTMIYSELENEDARRVTLRYSPAAALGITPRAKRRR